jgi:hypothetical protein
MFAFRTDRGPGSGLVFCKKTQNHHPEDRSSFYRCPMRLYDKAHRQTLILMADSYFLPSKLDMNKITIG